MDSEVFYLLQNPFPASTVPSFLCRVVASRASPLAVSAPFKMTDQAQLAAALTNTISHYDSLPSSPSSSSYSYSSSSTVPVFSSSDFTLETFLSNCCTDRVSEHLARTLNISAITTTTGDSSDNDNDISTAGTGAGTTTFINHHDNSWNSNSISISDTFISYDNPEETYEANKYIYHQQQQQPKRRLVRRYSLVNPSSCFDRLINNQRSAKDVRALLNQCLPRPGYFVTGFLSVTEASLSLPISETVQMAAPFLQPQTEVLTGNMMDFGGGSGSGGGFFLDTNSTNSDPSSPLSEEQVFAVSYAAAKLSHPPPPPTSTSTSSASTSPSSTSSRIQFTSPPEYGRPKRANGFHLASSRSSNHWTNDHTYRSTPSPTTPPPYQHLHQHQHLNQHQNQNQQPQSQPQQYQHQHQHQPQMVIQLDQMDPRVTSPNQETLYIRLPKTSLP